MSVLVIRRLSASMDRERDYRVMVDGTQRAQIGDDSTVQIGVTPGEHVVRLRIRWCASREVTVLVAHGDIVRLECRPNAKAWLAPLYVTIWRNRYISLSPVTSWTQ